MALKSGLLGIRRILGGGLFQNTSYSLKIMSLK